MFRKIRRRVVTLAFCSVLLAANAWAEDAPEAEESASPEDRAATIEAAIKANTEEAVGIIKKSAAFLAAQPSFSYKARTGFDVVQVNGQKLEFGATRQATVRRPDRLRVDATQRNGERRSLYFDGQKVSIDLPDDQGYVEVEKPGTLDAVIDYLVDDLQTPAPLHEFFKSNYFADAESRIRSGYYVETVTIGKRRCDHVAIRSDEVDLQLWIEVGERPLPCSLIITHKLEEGSPQFWAHFYDWSLSPKTPDSLFAYTPPEGAEKLSIQTAIEEAREDTEVQ